MKTVKEGIRHHEQTSQSQKSFTDRVQKLYVAMKDLSNPFQDESKELITLDTKTIAHPTAADLVRSHHEKGQAAFRVFFDGLGEEGTFYRPIKKNQVDFFPSRVSCRTKRHEEAST